MDIENSFRHSKSINDNQKLAINELEDTFVGLAHILNQLADSREKSLCLTKLQESKFWAIECVAKVWTREQN